MNSLNLNMERYNFKVTTAIEKPLNTGYIYLFMLTQRLIQRLQEDELESYIQQHLNFLYVNSDILPKPEIKREIKALYECFNRLISLEKSNSVRGIVGVSNP